VLGERLVRYPVFVYAYPALVYQVRADHVVDTLGLSERGADERFKVSEDSCPILGTKSTQPAMMISCSTTSLFL
jgi:hypothetical protein